MDKDTSIIGLENEFELMIKALQEGIPVILEGEAGTGKTEMAKAVSRYLGRELYRVDGDNELSSLKMQGWFDPPLVLTKGYNWETFMPGPLSEAMKNGGVFFFNEINRAPSETINGVLTALDERIINIPRLGTIKAETDFTCIFTCNPLDRVGTNPLPQAFFDRCLWIEVHHLPLEQAIKVVQLRTKETDLNLLDTICQIVEGSRKHPNVVNGGSIRAAIHMVKIAKLYRQQGQNPLAPGILMNLAKSTLLKRIKLRYDSEMSDEAVIEEIVSSVLGIVSEKKKQSLR